jgi:hypothetical protein
MYRQLSPILDNKLWEYSAYNKQPFTHHYYIGGVYYIREPLQFKNIVCRDFKDSSYRLPDDYSLKYINKYGKLTLYINRAHVYCQMSNRYK